MPQKLEYGMATVDTPIKLSNTGCVICLNWTVPPAEVKLVRKKCASFNMFQELKRLLSQELEEDLLTIISNVFLIHFSPSKPITVSPAYCSIQGWGQLLCNCNEK